MLQLTNQGVKDFVAANPKLVTAKPSKRFPELTVLKFTRKVFYGGLWNPVLENARGTVVDANYQPVIMPFRKVFNRFEQGVDIDRDEVVTAVRKVNGFMAAATYVPQVDKVVVSTTGSLDSDYVGYAETYITEAVKQVIREKYYDRTLLFEVCHPADPHIIKEDHGAYFLGARRIDWNIPLHGNAEAQKRYDQIAFDLDVMRPNWVDVRFSDLVKRVRTIRHEGFLVYGKSTSLKLKSPYYLTTKLFGRMEHQRLIENINNPDAMKERLSEEFYPLIDDLFRNMGTFSLLDEQQKFDYIKEFLDNVSSKS